eukprot:1161110-Rhodomonas_salina.1
MSYREPRSLCFRSTYTCSWDPVQPLSTRPRGAGTTAQYQAARSWYNRSVPGFALPGLWLGGLLG